MLHAGPNLTERRRLPSRVPYSVKSCHHHCDIATQHRIRRWYPGSTVTRKPPVPCTSRIRSHRLTNSGNTHKVPNALTSAFDSSAPSNCPSPSSRLNPAPSPCWKVSSPARSKSFMSLIRSPIPATRGQSRLPACLLFTSPAQTHVR